MNSTVRKILVVGGNGFIGSAVDWQKGDALAPQSFAHLFPDADGVVHTLGILLEDTSYKQALREGNVPRLLGSLFGALTGDGWNPLKRGVDASGGKSMSYETMNRDSALRVCEAFINSPTGVDPSWDVNSPRPFVYVSAEDIFRPIIPARYIETKREAERDIEEMMASNPNYRGVYMRPSLVYHAHHRPLTTPAAALLDLSATLHRKVPQGLPAPSSVLRSLGSTMQPSASRLPSSSSTTSSSGLGASPLESIANALTVPPIHVDHVGEAICAALDSRNGVKGVVDVGRMRELIGWSADGERQLPDNERHTFAETRQQSAV
ncbi:hypothetical protein NLJ89_g10206 [Agrocybe chaxingu]|uniref:Mitochondrial protein n=1 Tax=Agrocybe chaxingu TaxID=84603 RepID=A0A9W8JRR3_9AGAR|nr:hypothetical protein NLJ89_g10206 [Agrocybe chaxingu]